MQSLFSVITMDCWLSGLDFPYCSSHLQARQHYNGFYLLASTRANVRMGSASAAARNFMVLTERERNSRADFKYMAGTSQAGVLQSVVVN